MVTYKNVHNCNEFKLSLLQDISGKLRATKKMRPNAMLNMAINPKYKISTTENKK